MDDYGKEKITKIQQVANAMRVALVAGAEAYANGRAGARPIVDRHFTAGNQQRYGWPPLSRDYYMAKARGLIGHQSGGVFKPGGGKQGSKLDKAAEFQSSTGTMTGIGSGTNKPMLVNSGTLRHSVSGTKHSVAMRGEMVVITFSGLPEYAQYLEDGTGKMPRRSPVMPNAADKAEVIAAMRRHMDAALATGGPVANGTPMQNAGARMA